MFVGGVGRRGLRVGGAAREDAPDGCAFYSFAAPPHPPHNNNNPQEADEHHAGAGAKQATSEIFHLLSFDEARSCALLCVVLCCAPCVLLCSVLCCDLLLCSMCCAVLLLYFVCCDL